MSDLSSQQRAVKVVELLRSRPHTARELACELSCALRTVYYILDNLGLPVYNTRGFWHLLPKDSPLQGLYAYLLEGVETTPKGALIIGNGAPKRRDAVKWVAELKRILVPQMEG